MELVFFIVIAVTVIPVSTYHIMKDEGSIGRTTQLDYQPRKRKG